MLAARGFDRVPHVLRWKRFAGIVLSAAVLLGIMAIVVYRSRSAGEEGIWGQVVSWLASAQESWTTLSPDNAATTIAASASLASRQLMIASLCFACMAVIVILPRRHAHTRCLIFVVAIPELWLGSSVLRQSFSPTTQFPETWQAMIRATPDPQRVLITQGVQQNLAAALGIDAIGGYDPMVQQRWADMTFPLLGAAQRSGDLMVRRFLPSPRWPLLRLGRLVPGPAEVALPEPMPRVSLISTFAVVDNAEESLQAVRKPDFDPRKIVILEEQPNPAPIQQSDMPVGTVRYEPLSTDSMQIAADLNRPAILLVTDAWSPGWRVRPVQAAQASYQVLVADHALRAIPLAAGQHRFVLEYRPAAVPIGMGISLLTMVACSASATWMARAARRDALHRAE
jgi:hypothetical protein